MKSVAARTLPGRIGQLSGSRHAELLACQLLDVGQLSQPLLLCAQAVILRLRRRKPLRGKALILIHM